MTSSRTSAGLGLGVGIFLLTLGTAGTHLFLGLNFGLPLFILNGLGYLGLLAALQLPVPQLARFRGAVRWTLVGYTAMTIALWFLIATPDVIGVVNKAVEVALIALLLADAYRAHSEPSRETPSSRLPGA